MIIPVKKLLIVVLRDRERTLLRRLGELGVIHLKRLGEEDARRFVGTEIEKIRELEKLYYKFIELLGALSRLGVEEEERKLYEKYVELKKRLDHLLATEAELKKALEAVKALAELGEEEFPEEAEFSDIVFAIGTLPKGMVETVKKHLSGDPVAIEIKELSKDEALIYLVGMIEVKEKLDELLNTLPFKKIKLPENIPRECDKALTVLEEEIRKIENEVKIVKGELEELKKPLTSFVSEGETGLKTLKSLHNSFSKLQRELAVQTPPRGEEPKLTEKEIAKIIEETSKRHEALKEQMSRLLEEKRKLEELHALLEELEAVRNEVPEAGEFENIASIVGLISREGLEGFRRIAESEHILYEKDELKGGKILLHAVCLRERCRSVLNQLNALGFKNIEEMRGLPRNLREAREIVLRRIAELDSKIEKLRGELEELRRDFASKAGSIMQFLRINLKLGEALLNTLRSENMRIIQGWVPVDRLDHLVKELEQLRKQFRGALLYELEDPKPGEKFPTSLKNPKVFRIFESLIAQYGWPGPGEIDPTIISGILWMIMFGVMFPDAGHGLAIMALGAFFAYVFKGKVLGMNSEKLGKIMIGLGAFATVFGLLVGEFFLNEVTPLFPGLRAGWIENPNDVLWLIKIAIFFGAAQIILGMSIATLNHLRNGEKAEAIFGENGLAGIIMFAGFLLTAFYFVGITVIPGVLKIPALGINVLTHWPFFLMLAGMGMMAVKPFITKEPVSLSLGGLLESVTAFMANTFSYTRIAGFAIVHAALAMVVHRLMEANLVMGIGMGLIFLNLFALTIEFLVCVIQALRLLYYEFFTKFYEGRGFPYRPWRL